MRIQFLLFCAAFSLADPTFAQERVIIAQTDNQSVLRAGTPIALRLIETISTKEKIAKVNDRVRLEVAEDVTVNGLVIIPVGSPATGELTQVKYKGMWGKSGRFIGRILTVNANGRKIRLSGNFDSKGNSGGVGAAAVSAVVFAPAGFFMTGKSAEMLAGTTIRGFIDEDISFTFAETSTGSSDSPIKHKCIIHEHQGYIYIFEII